MREGARALVLLSLLPVPCKRFFLSEKIILGSEEIRRSLTRISHEILERNGGGGFVLVGIHTRGVPLAQRLNHWVKRFENVSPVVGALDIGLYRDDLSAGDRRVLRLTQLPVPIESEVVIVVDDVLYTGRTVRAAMDALTDFGRPKEIQLAVLVDRGHRELPIHADYVGKNVPTSRDEEIQVRMVETDNVDEVVLSRRP